jgi:hypothetical protein
MQSFRLRGILPEGAGFFSEGAILWPRAQAGQYPPVVGLDFGDPNGLTKVQKDNAAAILKKYVSDNAAVLGFSAEAPVLVPSFHSVFRINPDGSLRTDMVVEAVQTVDKPFNDSAPQFGKFPLRGGATLIIRRPVAGEPGAEKNEAPIRYVIARHLSGERAARQRLFGEHLGVRDTKDGQNRFQVDFSMVHGGI